MADKEVTFKVQYLSGMCWRTMETYKRKANAVKLANRMARNGDVTRVVENTTTVVYFK
jgi:hypothetical protein